MAGLIIFMLVVFFVIRIGRLEGRPEKKNCCRCGPVSPFDQEVGVEPPQHLPIAIPDEPGYKPIKHLVVTARGERWVSESLPKDDWRASEPATPSVYALISKPIGYRLVAGYHMIQDDDVADSPRGDSWAS